MNDAASSWSGARRPLTRRRMLGLSTTAAGLATANMAGQHTVVGGEP